MDNIVRGGNWYFAELNLWRVLDEVELPELKRSMDSFTPAGHHMGVEWPEEMEPLSARVKTKSNDPRIRAYFGREPGDWLTATYYENLVSFRTGEAKGRTVVLRGLINGVKQDSVRGMKVAGVDFAFSTLIFYHDLFDGRSVHRFDQFGGPPATIVDGNNPFARMGQNLAISGGTQL